MKQLDQRGALNVLLIPLIMAIVFLLASIGFGFWAFASREDYKNNVDEKVATAVEVAKKETATEKDNEFIEREKQPLKEYAGPSSFGSVKIKYPKTWSAYVSEKGSGNTDLDGYFHPNFVPGTTSDASYALRLQVVNRTFDEEAKRFDNDVRGGKTRARPYQAANVTGAVGLRFEGDIGEQKQGTLILLKLRDKTLRIWTEADQYKNDFEKNVLQNLTFSP